MFPSQVVTAESAKALLFPVSSQLHIFTAPTQKQKTSSRHATVERDFIVIQRHSGRPNHRKQIELVRNYRPSQKKDAQAVQQSA